MKKVRLKEVFEEYYRKTIQRFDEEANAEKEYKTLSTDSGFSYVVEGCDGFCPECKLVLKCETYDKIKDTWRLFYS